MNSLINFLIFIFFLFTFSSCSFNKNSKIWTGAKKISDSSIDYELLPLNKSGEILDKESNINLKISLKEVQKKIDYWISSDLNLSNTIPHIKASISIDNISKFKYKKIKNFSIIESDLMIGKKFIIFRDNSGSIIKFNKESGISWMQNVYSKKERKKIANLSLTISHGKVFVIDNLGKYYAMNLDSGKILWIKNNQIPFNSELKIYQNQLFATDTDDVLHNFSIKDGEEIWNIKTQSSFIKVLKKASLVIYKQNIFFTNSVGDLTKASISEGSIVWQIPTQNTLTNTNVFLTTSEIIINNETLFFSNNNNEFYSIDSGTGIPKWKTNINSYLRPIIIENYIFTITNDGFLIVLNKKDGKILRVTSLLNKFNSKIKKEISFKGFVVASNNIYITTNKGHLLVSPVTIGKVEKIYKISKSVLSEPFITSNDLYIVVDNGIILLN